jgi:hypothetical protein
MNGKLIYPFSSYQLTIILTMKEMFTQYVNMPENDPADGGNWDTTETSESSDPL